MKRNTIQTKELTVRGNKSIDKPVNDWIKKHPEYKIKDIKYGVTTTDTNVLTGALIIYEVNKGGK